MNFRVLFGPSTLVTAAFIGPGTLTTCTLAGIERGYELLWALAFAAIATIVLQEMAARLGWVSGSGLGEAIREHYQSPAPRLFAFVLVISAIFIGNASYEAGNLSGAIIGLELLFGKNLYWAMVVGVLALGLLWFGKYQVIEKILIGLVIIMSGCFLITALIVRPDLNEILKGFRPQAISQENFLHIARIVGTTVVPYNLFLHASTISKKWKKDASIWELRAETAIAILLGVGISMLIVITSAATREQIADADTIKKAQHFAVQLQPLAGNFAHVLMGVGFFAAGLSSALTAPLAAAYAVRGLFGWSDDDTQPKFIAVWVTILLVGIIVSLTQLDLIYIIKFAQVANAVVLPFIGIFLFRLANSAKVMKHHQNGLLSNVFGVLVLLVLFALSIASFINVYYYFFPA